MIRQDSKEQQQPQHQQQLQLQVQPPQQQQQQQQQQHQLSPNKKIDKKQRSTRKIGRKSANNRSKLVTNSQSSHTGHKREKSCESKARVLKTSQSERDRIFQNFIKIHPEYVSTHLDTLRETEFGRLDEGKQIYLDYTGGSLYGVSQVRQHTEMMMNGVYGNPHSQNPTSTAMTELDNRAREFIYKFFNASPEKYTVIFTPNATAALKLVGESYWFQEGGNYLLTSDNHNSVNGIREFAKSKNSKVTYIQSKMPDLRVDEDELNQFLEMVQPNKGNLFAFPAQSNFSGVQYPLTWIEKVQKKGWEVLVDCAAFVPSNRLDLSKWSPDFVDLSFYKMFGYPTGIGCLIMQTKHLQSFRRPWFAGGTVAYVSTQNLRHSLNSTGEAYEDGTVNYLGIPGVEIGLKFLNSVGIDTIHDRVMALTEWLIGSLLSLRHSNGSPLVTICGPHNVDRRGGTLALQFWDTTGNEYNVHQIEREATAQNISLRTGCFCNPWRT